VQKRYSVFYLIGSLASALAGILAYGFMQMGTAGGLSSGWRWIFIMEGILTCVIGIGGYFLLVDFPEQGHRSLFFLNKRECDWVLSRVERDRGDSKLQPFDLKKCLAHGSDLKVWGFAMLFFCTTTITYAIAYFLPIILRDDMGFSLAASQCLVAPPYVLAAISMFTSAYIGDRYRFRGPIIIFNCVIILIGLPIMGFHKTSGVRYFGVFLVTAGANANIPAVMTFQANNIVGQWKRAFCSASLVGFGGIGGIAGGLVFRSQDNPHYRPGIYACITSALLTIIITLALDGWFHHCNKQQRNGKRTIENTVSNTLQCSERLVSWY
jgi:sugar phosphate permease